MNDKGNHLLQSRPSSSGLLCYPNAYDPNFKGPVAKRSCTDVLCCIIFILFIIAYILLGLVAWIHGDPRRVAYPTDSKGHFCGQKGTSNENKTILFYFNLFSCTSPSVVVNLQCPTTQICVSKCPEKFLTYMEIEFAHKTSQNYSTYYSQFCKTPFGKPAKALAQLLLDDDCPTAIFPSKPFLQRCFPDFATNNGTLTVGNKTTFEDGSGRTRNAIELRTAANRVNKILDARAVGMKIFEDYATTWYWILIGLTIAMLLSCMFVILLRFIAGILFWVFMVGVIGIIGYGIWHCYQEYNNLQGRPNSHLSVYDLGIQTDLSMYFQLKQTWLAFMIILCILEVFIILMLIFLRERIRISITLLKEGSKAIGCIPTTLIYPILTFIFISICIAYWAVIAIYLATSGVPIYKVIAPEGKCKHENTTCNPEIFNTTEIAKACPEAQCNFAFYGGKSLYHQYVPTFQMFNLFVFFWLINFVIALGQCALAGAFASYYWAFRKPDDIPPHPLFTAFGRAIRYHTGSLAFGSLLLALIQMFKIVLEYLDRRLKDPQNNISKFLQCCLKCCFWCLENVIKYFNRNAYVMIAIYGKNFCRSARDAFNLLMRNILKIAVMDKVTDFVLILGKILVAGCIGMLAFLLFTQRLPTIIEGPTSLNYYWVPLLTVIIGSYLVAHGFFSVYAMCIDTIFICFLEDLERNDGSTERPYYMSQSLLKILKEPTVRTKKH
ncbi:choline transporter-like protein 5 isoform X1 [Canis lupus familiaris]|uniref:Choline transporter-like protein n=1 Tax=Canis lupus familiaris TaxID=9615 RepID=A0A8C0NPM6_CANLF|nr:choline transporter-like protein 5 isoform X1 [Canis lupus familiaris]XP_005622114.1 choline transporter-like protein 5 isoform X1 [Canis lupus familiaris]XP_022276332.1 choline transporter-like protein 5 isoform X1 [Canis lupus familiaris]XP_025273749.1 choline transporter-like protein 5 isoform X1 [Canis lupus dingo]XP_025273750.1 choline transporter-like protein 5 isoform X1 [Canis lupus dingo]XP_025273751.1 choline transporter-like protein 5 isoform X1 [Canis lupus dingo]XP_038397574.1|eukprot:XP_005622113.1 choline transporter-like protein 5 isoform X1 [Canis lupus familiaris]